MRTAAAAFVLAELADLVTFALVASAASIGGEANPLARTAFLTFGVPIVGLVKVLGIGVVLVFALVLSRRRPQAAGLLLVAFAAIAAGCAISNVVVP